MTHFPKQFCLGLIIAACVSLTFSQGLVVPQAPQGAWPDFAPPDGSFAVRFPGTPTVKVAEEKTSNGKRSVHNFRLDQKAVSYSVSYIDFPDDVAEASVKERLNSGLGMFVQNKETKILSERELKLGTFSGREFQMLQHQSVFGILRAYLVRHRLFMVALFPTVEVAFDKKPVSSRAEDRTPYFNQLAGRFFDSFEIPAATETMGEVERKLQELRKANGAQGVITMVGSAAPSEKESITKGVINGRAIRLVTPSYSRLARAAHATGTVSIQVLIDPDGNVAAAEAVEGHPLLRPAAINAARESKFTPTKLEGKPVMVLGVILYNFNAP